MVSKEKEKKEVLPPEKIFDALMRRWSILILKDIVSENEYEELKEKKSEKIFWYLGCYHSTTN